MSKREKNLWEIAEWHAIQREASLVRHLVGSGVTGLGRANFSDGFGEYYTAFFGLSVGLERLAKLILVVDHSILNGGSMPRQQVIRKFGHNILGLVDAAERVSEKHNVDLDYTRPRGSITKEILQCLDSFADAKKGRYANFGSLVDPVLGEEEPIRKWWEKVAESILRDHFYGKGVERRAEKRAEYIEFSLSDTAITHYVDETGDTLQDTRSVSIRRRQSETVQRYGRYYSLVIVRWLSDLYCRLARSACYNNRIDAYYGSWEHLQVYIVHDKYLKRRKVWPPK
jgi:hypothetical protein